MRGVGWRGWGRGRGLLLDGDEMGEVERKDGQMGRTSRLVVFGCDFYGLDDDERCLYCLLRMHG